MATVFGRRPCLAAFSAPSQRHLTPTPAAVGLRLSMPNLCEPQRRASPRSAPPPLSPPPARGVEVIDHEVLRSRSVLGRAMQQTQSRSAAQPIQIPTPQPLRCRECQIAFARNAAVQAPPAGDGRHHRDRRNRERRFRAWPGPVGRAPVRARMPGAGAQTVTSTRPRSEPVGGPRPK